MKSILSALALVAAMGVAGAVQAEDAMSTPMAGDAMSTDAMGDDATSSMTPDEVLKACLAKAEMEADSMKKDEAGKACQDAHDMAMKGDAMGGNSMMSSEPMANDGAMAPAAQ